MKAATVGMAKCILKIWMDAENAVIVRLNVIRVRLKISVLDSSGLGRYIVRLTSVVRDDGQLRNCASQRYRSMRHEASWMLLSFGRA